MKIDVKHVAKLANLTISDKDLEKFQKQLSSVLDHINKLQELNTNKVPETSQITGLENVMREDVSDSARVLNQDEALSNTSSKQNGFFKVKGVLNEE